MLIVRGVGMGMLFIPITTMSLSTLKGREIGQGAAFTGMMRQLGGSFGIALITTFMARQTVVHRSAIVSHLDINDPTVIQRIKGIQASFMAKGMSPDVALQSAYKLMDYSVSKQASVLSYMDVFLYIGVLFLLCIPFILMIKNKKKGKVDISEAMH